jgi:UDP-3-O-[3-hydroxymyristoyl] N-acetylglucosamine deacetylase
MLNRGIRFALEQGRQGGLTVTKAGMWQQTIQQPVRCEGVGLHSGQPVAVWLRPAEPNTGVRFVKKTPAGDSWLQATIDEVSQTRLATSLGQGVSIVHTVEHLLAAISGMGIDNIVVELSASEIPIMDGSARPFVEAIVEAGIVRQSAPRSVMVITKAFEVRDGDGWISAEPASRLEIHNTVEYDHAAIGRQVFEYQDNGPASFAATLAPARTFGFLRDVEHLKASGYILGGSLENAVVVGPAGILNPEGLRWPDEFVRHKTLDLVGDLTLLGTALCGRITAFRAGHRLHAQFMTYLMAHPECRQMVGATQGAFEPAGAVS